MNQPSNFHGAPSIGSNHPAQTPAQEWKPMPPARASAGGPLNHTVLVTVYREGGRVRLTKEAAALFNIGATAELRPGSAAEPWVLDCRPDAPQPVSAANSTWQFRSGYRLERVFPHNSTRTKIELALANWHKLGEGLHALWPIG